MLKRRSAGENSESPSGEQSRQEAKEASLDSSPYMNVHTRSIVVVYAGTVSIGAFHTSPYPPHPIPLFEGTLLFFNPFHLSLR